MNRFSNDTLSWAQTLSEGGGVVCREFYGGVGSVAVVVIVVANKRCKVFMNKIMLKRPEKMNFLCGTNRKIR